MQYTYALRKSKWTTSEPHYCTGGHEWLGWVNAAGRRLDSGDWELWKAIHRLHPELFPDLGHKLGWGLEVIAKTRLSNRQTQEVNAAHAKNLLSAELGTAAG